MKRFFSALTVATLAGAPALAAGDEAFFTLRSTEFVVTIAFLIFVGILIWSRAHGHVFTALDSRADGIRAELESARKLHDDAKAILAGYDKKHEEMKAQSALIVETARREASDAAEQAKMDLQTSIARRLQAAADQIASAEAAAVREVRNSAIGVAVAAAGDMLAKQMTAADHARLADASIDEVAAKLH